MNRENKLTTKEKFVKKIEIYSRINKKLIQNNLTFWGVLKYVAEEKNELYSPIHNIHVNWVRFEKTYAGISLEKLELYEKWVDEYIENPPKKLWQDLYVYIRTLVAENGIPIVDIYSHWIKAHNENATAKSVSIIDFSSFQSSFFNRNYNNHYRFSYKRLKEIKEVLEVMIYNSYDYEKKTYKRKYLQFN